MTTATTQKPCEKCAELEKRLEATNKALTIVSKTLAEKETAILKLRTAYDRLENMLADPLFTGDGEDE